MSQIHTLHVSTTTANFVHVPCLHILGYSKILTCTKGTHHMGSQYINEIIVMLLSHSEPLQLAVAHDRLCHLLHVLLIV